MKKMNNRTNKKNLRTLAKFPTIYSPEAGKKVGAVFFYIISFAALLGSWVLIVFSAQLNEEWTVFPCRAIQKHMARQQQKKVSRDQEMNRAFMQAFRVSFASKTALGDWTNCLLKNILPTCVSSMSILITGVFLFLFV
jgi:hypothetical protein